jgi:hypothetical protein
MNRLVFLLFILTGCPKKNDSKTLIEAEREEAIKELMNSSEDDEILDEFPEEDEDE